MSEAPNQTKKPNRITNRITIISTVTIVFITGILYVSLSLTPSHYAAVLQDVLGMDYQPLAGKANLIRGDEYSVVTPYFQIAVNNDFERFNKFSPYNEDLRHFYGLPLADWALGFKPYMWGFWILDAARAFSLYHYLMIVAFITGHALFLSRLGLPFLYGLIIGGILFFSHHNQVWWSSNAPVLSLTVWLFIPFLSNWSIPIKFVTTFYIAMMALLGLLYPSWQISLVYVYFVLALCFRFDKFRLSNIAICLVGFLIAGATSYYYLQDTFMAMQNTVYPGNSKFGGGGARDYFLWAQLSPHSLIDNYFDPIFHRTSSNH